jgi:hypothetical protein
MHHNPDDEVSDTGCCWPQVKQLKAMAEDSATKGKTSALNKIV